MFKIWRCSTFTSLSFIVQRLLLLIQAKIEAPDGGISSSRTLDHSEDVSPLAFDPLISISSFKRVLYTNTLIHNIHKLILKSLEKE